jgi:diketogulonate reductase-like aldo/keto reductase
VLSAIAAKHGTTPSVVLLSWAIGQDFVLIVTIESSTVMIEEYLQALAIKLSPEEQEDITQARCLFSEKRYTASCNWRPRVYDSCGILIGGRVT